jgi:hypothetical protein
MSEVMLETWGKWMGDLTDTMDAFILVAASTFVIAFTFLTLLRFFVGCVVWTSILVVFLLFLAVGGLCYVRHTQCIGVGLLASGHQKVNNVVVAGQSIAASALSGENAPSEALTGKGEDYRGAQSRTRSHRLCQAWASDTPWPSKFKSSSHPGAGLDSNFCRNPGGSGATIWCYTMDGSVTWELCNPIGTINAECVEGYEVQNEDMRRALEIIAYVLWAIAGLWCLFIVCTCRKVHFAIAINRVAATFVCNTPSLLLVPMWQTIIGILWCMGWAFSAAYLISRVPKDHVPSAYFETYAEAYGSQGAPGKCTGSFINGFVYKYAGNSSDASDPCSGFFGDTSAMTPRCWACYPPRYIIDWRVAASFFCFLWNNALLVATGQFIIAFACGYWFFTPHEQKYQSRSVMPGVWFCFRYHFGSLAFGAFVLAVVQFIWYALMYVEKQATPHVVNSVHQCVHKIVTCFLWCMEEFIKFLNKNAYVQIALLGKDFCSSAKAAFWLVVRNATRFAWVGMLGCAINLVGLAFIIVASALCGYLFLKLLHPGVTPLFPLLIYICIAYLIAKLHMNVFHLAVATILQCYLATEEMGGDDGFVPLPLMNLDMTVKDMATPRGPREEIKPVYYHAGREESLAKVVQT